ncbi:tRNA-specific adenosine deaminase [Bacillus sp. AFS015802]|uniref:nucleoside deaminase n=1 Tax=Bacillus sp. AFS015802 TaxID=2033486 RepID=UPI000BF8C51C|nr:nucleoside deaminase [Bacillus sp. AFS015802]PFA63088.1 tRNA-specific adenosine deaminase [Bacillus sp. AFS015802]
MDYDRYYLELALTEAEKALQENTYPVGAVIVDENQHIIAKGRNRVHPDQDVTAHAEMDAIRNAGSAIFKAKIERKAFTIYTTLEPCLMCTGGILFANMKRVVWALNDGEGFGGYKKINGAGIFERKFQEVDVREEPYADLKMKQLELMRQWESNPNHVVNLRNTYEMGG